MLKNEKLSKIKKLSPVIMLVLILLSGITMGTEYMLKNVEGFRIGVNYKFFSSAIVLLTLGSIGIEALIWKNFQDFLKEKFNCTELGLRFSLYFGSKIGISALYMVYLFNEKLHTRLMVWHVLVMFLMPVLLFFFAGSLGKVALIAKLDDKMKNHRLLIRISAILMFTLLLTPFGLIAYGVSFILLNKVLYELEALEKFDYPERYAIFEKNRLERKLKMRELAKNKDKANPITVDKIEDLEDRKILIEFNVAGITFEGRQLNVRNLEVGHVLEIRVDSENEVDSNTLAVYVGEELIGFVPKDYRDEAFNLITNDACVVGKKIRHRANNFYDITVGILD